MLVLAGGVARRLPGKLLLPVDGVPLIVRVVRQLGSLGPLVISANDAFSPEIAAELPLTIVPDTLPGQGPLAALAGALGLIETRWLFVAAADMPFLDAMVARRLIAALEPGDEAAVPLHVTDRRTRLEPLAALYSQSALERLVPACLAKGERSMHALVAVMRARSVGFEDSGVFFNVNTAQDYDAVLGSSPTDDASSLT